MESSTYNKPLLYLFSLGNALVAFLSLLLMMKTPNGWLPIHIDYIVLSVMWYVLQTKRLFKINPPQ